MQLIKVPHTTDPSQPLHASIFLAGPCPRTSGTADWRHACADLFRSKGFTGSLFWPVPDAAEDTAVAAHFNIDAQVAWETKHLKMADIILFWVPRKIDSAFAGFTTNVEFGLYHKSGKIVMGYPPDAEKMRYIAWWCDKVGVCPIVASLEALVDLCLEKLKNLGYSSNDYNGTKNEKSVPTSSSLTARYHGEQFIPLILWRSQAFQDWYQNQKAQGNKLIWGEVDYVFDLFNEIDQNIASSTQAKRPRTFQSAFIAILKAHIQISKENNRIKNNEVVIFRPDVCAVVPFYQEEEEEEGSIKDVKVVLTSEFRTPCRNSHGNNVIEPPCGSSWEHVDYVDEQDNEKKLEIYKKIALEELHEEADIDSDSSRLIYVGSRQVAATLSAHHSHVFAVKLSKEDFEKCEKAVQEEKVFGVEADTERTKLRILKFSEILSPDSGLDWSTVGIISQTLMKII